MVRSDPVVRAALMMVMLPIAEADWTVEPAGSEPEDLEVAEFVRRAVLEHLDWRKVVWQAIPARYGHALLEEHYEAVDWSLSVADAEGEQQELPQRTFWAPAAFQPRLGRTIWQWLVDSTGRLEGVKQQRIDPQSGQYSEVVIPTSQLVVVTNEQEGDDYTGVSVLRSAYRSWYTKEKLEVIDAIAKERAGAGVFVGKIPDKDWDSEADGMEENLRALRANEESFLVLRKEDDGTEGQEVEALDMKAASQADCLPSLNYHVTQILWSVLAPWMNLGQGGEGARATAETQDDPFYLGLGYMAGTVASAFNRQHIPRLVGFNYQTDRYPRLVCGDIRPLDIGALITSIAALLTAGGIETDAGLEAALRVMLGLPEKVISEDDEEPDENETPPPPPPPGGEAAADEPPATTREPPPAPSDGDVEDADDPAARALSAAHAETPGRWRPLTHAETFVALDQIDATVEEQRQRYQALCRDEAVRIADHYANEIVTTPIDAELRPADGLTTALADQIQVVLTAAAEFGRHSVRQELSGQRAQALATTAPGTPEGLARWLQRRATLSAKAVVRRLRTRAESLASSAGGPEGAPPRERSLAALTSTAESGLRAEAVATVAQALSAGRRAETEAAATEGLATRAQYSAILDSGTCGPCRELDGDTYDVASDEYERDYPPLYACDGGDACRCLMVVLYDDEEAA